MRYKEKAIPPFQLLILFKSALVPLFIFIVLFNLIIFERHGAINIYIHTHIYKSLFSVQYA